MEAKHYDLGLERAVLSGLFQYGVEVYVEIQDIISESDFYNHQNAIIYRCLKYIVEHNLSVDTVSITSAANSLSLKDEILSDTEFLKSLKTLNVNKDNVSEFAIQVKKLSFIRDLLVETKKVVDNLSKISSQETIDNIIDAVEKPIINAVSLGSTNKKPEILGDDILQYVKFLGENPCDVVGIPTGFPRFDKSIGGGLRRKTVNVIAARPKALRYGSLVYTENGPIKIEDVKIGQKILHPFKGLVEVEAVWDHKNIDIYRLEFKDGDFIDCCEDHLWEVNRRSDGKRFVKTIKELFSDVRYKDSRYKWDIRLPETVEFENKELPIDSYVLGVILGDGSISNGTLCYHTADDEIHNYLKNYFNNLGYEVKLESKKSKASTYRVNGFQDKLREAGVFGHNCYNKFIPKNYIYNSKEVRLSLLAGLLDTDGDCTINKNSKSSRSRFGSVSLQLCKDVKEIVQSLGGLCSINTVYTSCDGKRFKSYRCEIRLPENINAFRLSRKSSKFSNRKIGKLKRTISKIEKITKDNARCLTLSENDGLFMTTNYIVTHNTGKSYIADAISVNVTNENIPVLMLDTEMSKEDHSHRMLAMISGVKLDDIENGSFAKDEISKDKVIKAAEKLSKLKYYYINVAGEPFNIIANQIKRWVIQTVGKDENGKTNDCLVIYDYLKLMTSNNISANLQEYQALGFQISELHNLCVRLDIPCLSFVQLNREGETKESTDVVSGSDRIVWLCTSFTIFKHKTLEEMAEDGKIVCTRKLVPIVSRHGAGLDYGDYINIKFDGSIGLIKEHKTRNELKRSLGDKGMLEDGEINKVDIKIE